VPVREHEDLAVVTGLKELFCAAVQQPDSRIGPGDDVTLKVQSELQGAVLRGVKIAEVEDEVCIEMAGCPESDEDLA
jgi:hypothetical protein